MVCPVGRNVLSHLFCGSPVFGFLACVFRFMKRGQKEKVSISNPQPVVDMIIDENSFRNPRPAPYPPGEATKKAAIANDVPTTPKFRKQPGKRRGRATIARTKKRLDEFRENALARFPLNDADGIENYRRHEVLAKGGHAVVYLGTVSKKVGQIGMLVAIKQINILSSPNPIEILNEIQLIKENQHENIVQFLDCHFRGATLWIVLEYMDAGCLTDLILMIGGWAERRRRTVLSEGNISFVCQQV
jgi:serine/threonine protein kinase